MYTTLLAKPAEDRCVIRHEQETLLEPQARGESKGTSSKKKHIICQVDNERGSVAW
jgi:hypothetical protein